MHQLSLSTLATLIRETVDTVFGQQLFWVLAETADVKKYPQRRWCFLKLIEKNGADMVCEMQANIWPSGYNQLLHFEKYTGQAFAGGMQVACQVKVVFHERFGLRLEIVKLDPAYTRGLHDLQKQQTLDRLVHDHPRSIRFEDGEYITFNKQLKPAKVWQRIALIAASGSDGYRDFMKELEANEYGFAFKVTLYPVQVQGAVAVHQMTTALEDIHAIAGDYDIAVLVRGGGSDTDFAPFDDYDLALKIAQFPIPVITGIGHDRNTSIADMMGWQQKTPTKAAAVILDTAIRFASDLLAAEEKVFDLAQKRIGAYRNGLDLAEQNINWFVPRRLMQQKQKLLHAGSLISLHVRNALQNKQQAITRMERQVEVIPQKILLRAKEKLEQRKHLVQQVSPEVALSRGFAIVMQEERIIVSPGDLREELPMTTILRSKKIISDIKAIEP